VRHGIVVSLQARMSVVLRSIEGSEIEVECVVDTGFEVVGGGFFGGAGTGVV